MAEITGHTVEIFPSVTDPAKIEVKIGVQVQMSTQERALNLKYSVIGWIYEQVGAAPRNSIVLSKSLHDSHLVTADGPIIGTSGEILRSFYRPFDPADVDAGPIYAFTSFNFADHTELLKKEFTVSLTVVSEAGPFSAIIGGNKFVAPAPPGP